MEHTNPRQEFQETVQTLFANNPARGLFPSLRDFQVNGRYPEQEGMYVADGELENRKYGNLTFGLLAQFTAERRMVVLSRVSMILKDAQGVLDIHGNAQFKPHESHAHSVRMQMNVGGILVQCQTISCDVYADSYAQKEDAGLIVRARFKDSYSRDHRHGHMLDLDLIAAQNKAVKAVSDNGFLIDATGKKIKRCTLASVADTLCDSIVLLRRVHEGMVVGRARRY